MSSTEQKIAELETKIEKLSTDVEDLVAAWKAASWFVGLVKWVSGIAAALLVIVSFYKEVK